MPGFIVHLAHILIIKFASFHQNSYHAFFPNKLLYSHFVFLEAEIRKHMASLRTQYSRMVKPAPSGSAAKKSTKRQDWVRTNLGFLKPHLKKRTSVSNLVVRIMGIGIRSVLE